MKCLECGAGGAKPFRVEYVSADAERISLCTDCRSEFEDGDLVDEVQPVRTDDDAT